MGAKGRNNGLFAVPLSLQPPGRHFCAVCGGRQGAATIPRRISSPIQKSFGIKKIIGAGANSLTPDLFCEFYGLFFTFEK